MAARFALLLRQTDWEEHDQTRGADASVLQTQGWLVIFKEPHFTFFVIFKTPILYMTTLR